MEAVGLHAGSNPLFKDQELAVVGGGDTAAEEAMYLTKYGKKVMMGPLLVSPQVMHHAVSINLCS